MPKNSREPAASPDTGAAAVATAAGKKPPFFGPEAARLREIVRVFTKNNVLVCLAEQKHPEKVREAFEELGPTFVKAGQILSTRTDIVTEAFAEEFKKLQDGVKSNDFSEVEPTIVQQAGLPLDEVFQSIGHKPLASASIGQVHTAVLKNGQPVVVKVQHPGIREEMTMDIALLEKAVPLIKHIPAAGMMDPAAIVAELKRSLLDELDFTKEADNIEQFHRLNKDVPYIRSPKVYREYSGDSLLIMDFMQGVKISDYVQKADEQIAKGDTAIQEVKKRLAKEIVDNYMKQIFEDGYFHADPHPGNLLVWLPPEAAAAGAAADADATAQPDGGSGVQEEEKRDAAPAQGDAQGDSAGQVVPPPEGIPLPFDVDVSVNGVSLGALFQKQDLSGLFAFAEADRVRVKPGSEKLVYIDFGMMGRLDEATIKKLNALMGAFSQQDDEALARAILALCKARAPEDMDDYIADVRRLFEQYYNMPIGEMSLPAIFGDVATLCAQYRLKLPQSVTLLAKGVGTIEGIVLSLDPELSIMSAVMPYAKQYMRSQFDLKGEAASFARSLYRAAKAMPELPVKLMQVVDTLSRGEIKLSMKHTHLDDLFKRLEVVINRLVMGLIVAALIIGSSMLVHFGGTNAGRAISILATAGFALALVLAIIMIWQTYHKKK